MCNTAGIVDRILGVSNVLVGRIFVEEFLNECLSGFKVIGEVTSNC